MNQTLQSVRLRALKYKQRNAQNKHPLPTFLFLSNNVKEHKKTNTKNTALAKSIQQKAKPTNRH
jgi:hypothetical protein